MDELIKHIEQLLLENECVIIPNMGGFISHYTPSQWIEEEGIFLPPMNVVAFNERLSINDGLLAQSYMVAHKMSYEEAMKMISIHVIALKKALRNSGKIEILNIGHLTLNIENHYEFIPNENGIDSPALFGLTSFSMQKLDELKQAQETKTILSIPLQPVAKSTVQEKEEKVISKETVIIHINRRLLRTAVAAVIAIITFFSFSTPVENTFVDQGNYAELFSLNVEGTSLFKKVEESTSIFAKKKPAIKTTAVVTKKIEPKTTEKVKAKKVAQHPTITTLRYHIIIASLNTVQKGNKVLTSYQKKGYTNAYMIHKNGKYRIALSGYSNKKEASQALYKVRKTTGLASAWLCYARINK
jgi:hypothetical protein